MLLDTNIVSTFLKRDAQKRTPRLYNFVKAQLSAEGLAIALPAGCRRVLAGCRRRAATGQDGREDRCPIRPMAQTHWLSPTSKIPSRSSAYQAHEGLGHSHLFALTFDLNSCPYLVAPLLLARTEMRVNRHCFQRY
jgi:hypothetical protein